MPEERDLEALKNGFTISSIYKQMLKSLDIFDYEKCFTLLSF